MDDQEIKPVPWNLWNLPAHPQLYKDAIARIVTTPSKRDKTGKAQSLLSALHEQRSRE